MARDASTPGAALLNVARYPLLGGARSRGATVPFALRLPPMRVYPHGRVGDSRRGASRPFGHPQHPPARSQGRDARASRMHAPSSVDDGGVSVEGVRTPNEIKNPTSVFTTVSMLAPMLVCT
mgnify:CR=1 FL=1